MSAYPEVGNKDLVGTYPAFGNSGGGYVWDDVLEYRVWCHPHGGAPDIYEGSDYYYAFDSHDEAFEFSKENPGSEEPLALVLQKEYIDEAEAGKYLHVKEQRITEWPVEFLKRPKRSEKYYPRFLIPKCTGEQAGHITWKSIRYIARLNVHI